MLLKDVVNPGQGSLGLGDAFLGGGELGGVLLALGARLHKAGFGLPDGCRKCIGVGFALLEILLGNKLVAV